MIPMNSLFVACWKYSRVSRRRWCSPISASRFSAGVKGVLQGADDDVGACELGPRLGQPAPELLFAEADHFARYPRANGGLEIGRLGRLRHMLTIHFELRSLLGGGEAARGQRRMKPGCANESLAVCDDASYVRWLPGDPDSPLFRERSVGPGTRCRASIAS